MHTKTQAGFTLVELLIVVALIGVLAAIATPALLRARQSSNEASAIASLRAISSAQSAYAAACGNSFYAPSLENLSTAPPGGTLFISPDLATTGVVKSGYALTMTGTAAAGALPSCNGGAVTSGYRATATPVAGAGGRAFGTNTTGTIFFLIGQVPPAVTDSSINVGTPIQ